MVSRHPVPGSFSLIPARPCPDPRWPRFCAHHDPRRVHLTTHDSRALAPSSAPHPLAPTGTSESRASLLTCICLHPSSGLKQEPCRRGLANDTHEVPLCQGKLDTPTRHPIALATGCLFARPANDSQEGQRRQGPIVDAVQSGLLPGTDRWPCPTVSPHRPVRSRGGWCCATRRRCSSDSSRR
jgi:hypothetical protein